ncbi:MAG: chemotaxis protein CheX, partial [Candidatus Acidiferrales bacterium]
MRMDLIQPFIGSLDAVLAEMMKAPAKIVDLTMEESGYRRKGLAASVAFRGQVEGRVILDMDPSAAAQVASYLSGGDVDPDESIVPETVSELANMVIGNAVTQLNDGGFQFKVFPPEILTAEQVDAAGHDSEATILCFETPNGNVHLNISMQY